MTRRLALESALLFFAAVAVFPTAYLGAQNPAPAPPMGWNEWDAYGMTITEADFMTNARVLSGLKQYGWQYAMIDAGWYIENPATANPEAKSYVLDGDGRLTPAESRFSSAAGGKGFKPLADWLHGQGLKFGIHVMPGVPRQSVARNLPIAGSNFHAVDAADTTQTCSWDAEFYAAKDNAAGQAYYDSIMRLYADWGVDYIKLGCVTGLPSLPTAIRQIAEAIKRTGRPMVLALSPGPPPQEYLNFVARYAQVWRISEEHWDFWQASPGITGHMVGVREAFDLFAQWAPYVKPGNWVDGDLLPVGWLGPHPGWGEPRQSRETADELRTEFTLWAVSRSPLILGANLTRLDDFTRSLITNREVIEINQQSWKSYPVNDLPPGFEHARVWESLTGRPDRPRRNFAFFNLDGEPVTLHSTWKQLGFGGKHAARNLWDGSRLAPSTGIDVTLPGHGSAIYHVE